MRSEDAKWSVQEYMQGWYTEYCNKTGQFCDQVKLKHSTKDTAGKEIVYNVPSSSGYKPPSSTQSNEDDINISYLLQRPSPTTTKKPNNANALKIKRKTKLVNKLKKIFKNLEEKYKDEKKKIALAPIEFLKKEKPKKTIIMEENQEEDEKFQNSQYDEFFDFVPMEYEAVEDVVIENY